MTNIQARRILGSIKGTLMPLPFKHIIIWYQTSNFLESSNIDIGSLIKN